MEISGGSFKLRIIRLVLTAFFFLTIASAVSASDVVVTELPNRVVVYGANLTSAWKNTVNKLILTEGSDPRNVDQVLTVTNAEERQALSGKVADSVIGSRSISSVYVERTEKGSGIEVITKNITVMTSDMYRSALATGGVSDAKVIAAAPIPVSGTAALTGVFKAYEAMTGTKLSGEAKDIAQSELVEVGELGKQMGNADAIRFFNEVKEQVIKDKVTDPKQIRAIIIKVSVKYARLKLTNSQLDRLVHLFQRMAKLPLSIDTLATQLKGLISWEKVGKLVDKVKSVFGR